jgi:hypothetical protein
MRAALAFVNGAGSSWKRREGGTDRGLLTLTDLLLNPGIASKPGRWSAARAPGRADGLPVSVRSRRKSGMAS